MINKLLNQFVSTFGFNCTGDFTNSIVHSKILGVTLPLAGISALLENSLGLQHLTLISFVVLVTLELLTGLIAAKVKGEQIVSNKFGRFGLKVLVWLILLYVTNSMRLEYSGSLESFRNLASGFFTWLHGTMFIYIVLEYLISVLENLGAITGKSKDNLIKSIIDKLNNLLKK